MDTYETTKKKSPFADSPYECPWEAEVTAAQPEPAPQPRQRTGRGVRPILAILLALACTVGAAASTSALWQGKMDRMEAAMDDKFAALEQLYKDSQQPSEPSVSVPSSPMTPSQVYSRNVRALVAVFARYESASGYGESVGSGFFISADGYIVTNYHVVGGASSVSVTAYDGQSSAARIIGYDSSNDVAVLKIERTDLPFAILGKSDKVNVGDQVAIIGNPLGELTATLTVGYISAKDRLISDDNTAINMLQTDAAINSGNSGGPMFNMYGEVIGIVTAKFSGSSGSGALVEGLGFAIPIDDVAGIISDLKEFGYVTGAYLGVYVRDVSAEGQSYGLPAGAYIDETVPGYCAAKAGIRAGDVIVNLGGYDVDSLNALTRALRRYKAGDTTSVTVYRNGKREYLTITFDEKPVVKQQNASPNTTAPEAEYDNWLEEFFSFFW